MIAYKTNEYSDMSLKQVEDKMKNFTETRAIIERLHSRPKTAVEYLYYYLSKRASKNITSEKKLFWTRRNQ